MRRQVHHGARHRGGRLRKEHGNPAVLKGFEQVSDLPAIFDVDQCRLDALGVLDLGKALSHTFTSWYWGIPPRSEFSNRRMVRLPACVRATRPARKETRTSSKIARIVAATAPVRASGKSAEIGSATF